MSEKISDDMKNSIAAAISCYYPVSVKDVKYTYDRLLSWDKTIKAVEMSLGTGMSLFDMVTAGMNVLSVK